jgi:hypothetical protein
MSAVPANLRYRESHEWIDPATGVVGITDHAQHELTDVVFVELPKVGAKVKAGDHVAVVESVKAASDIRGACGIAGPHGCRSLPAAHRMSARTEPAAKPLEMSPPSAFSRRHLGPTEDEAVDMARSLGCSSVDELISKVVPGKIRLGTPLRLPDTRCAAIAWCAPSSDSATMTPSRRP